MTDQAPPRFRPVPWSELASPHDAELWIEEHNRCLQELIRPHETGYGVRFTLREGGSIVMQTNDGAIILDLDDEAQWIGPLISAAAQVEASAGSIWILPDDKLVQLLIGLSSLVESTTLVVGHLTRVKNSRSVRMY